MKLYTTVALLVSVLCLRVDAVTQIVAIGDSLTDDCTHGAKQVVDAALDSTAVSTCPCCLQCRHAHSIQSERPAGSLRMQLVLDGRTVAVTLLYHAELPWSALLPRVFLQQWTHVCCCGCWTLERVPHRLW